MGKTTIMHQPCSATTSPAVAPTTARGVGHVSSSCLHRVAGHETPRGTRPSTLSGTGSSKFLSQLREDGRAAGYRGFGIRATALSGLTLDYGQRTRVESSA